MPEMRFTEFPALSIGPRVGSSQSASGSMFDYFSYLLYLESCRFITFFYSECCMRAISECHLELFVMAHKRCL